MARRLPKLVVKAYGKTFSFDKRKFCGYIQCDRLKKVFPISHGAVPYKSKRGDSYLCLCGKYTSDDPFYHTLRIKGKELKYGDW